MSELDYATSILLGVVQGVTEFLPVSSSGHLALIQKWLDLEPAGPGMLLFNVFAHVGTLIAVGIVFAGPARRYLCGLVHRAEPQVAPLYAKRQGSACANVRRAGDSRGHQQAGFARPAARMGGAVRITLLAVAACVPTGVIGYTFQARFEAAFGHPYVIGIALIVTGVLLALTGRIGRGRRGWRRFTWWQAVLVGVAQAGAIWPGVSRSGATICVATYLGLRRRWAAQFSFLIAVPAIAGAALLKTKQTLEIPESALAAVAWGPILLGSVVSLVVGVVALRLLLRAVGRAKLHYFAPYCWLLGAWVLISTP